MTFHRCTCGAPVRQRDHLCADCWDAERTAAASPHRASDFDHEKDLQEQRRESEADHADMRAEVRDEGLHRRMGGL